MLGRLERIKDMSQAGVLPFALKKPSIESPVKAAKKEARGEPLTPKRC